MPKRKSAPETSRRRVDYAVAWSCLAGMLLTYVAVALTVEGTGYMLHIAVVMLAGVGAFHVCNGRVPAPWLLRGALAGILGKEELAPEVSRRYRVGDIRHCFADISAAKRTLGYAPAVDFADGLRELADWLKDQTAEDRVDHARGQLEARGLVV